MTNEPSSSYPADTSGVDISGQTRPTARGVRCCVSAVSNMTSIFLAIDIFATATPLGRAEAAGGMESYQRDEFLAFIQRVLVRIHVPTNPDHPSIPDSHSNAPEPPPSCRLFRELKTPTPDACDDRARTTPAWRPRSRPWTSRTCASCVTPSPRRTTRASRARTSAHSPSITTTSEDRAC